MRALVICYPDSHNTVAQAVAATLCDDISKTEDTAFTVEAGLAYDLVIAPTMPATRLVPPAGVAFIEAVQRLERGENGEIIAHQRSGHTLRKLKCITPMWITVTPDVAVTLFSTSPQASPTRRQANPFRLTDGATAATDLWQWLQAQNALMPYPLFRGVEIIGTRHSEEPLPLSHAATIVTGGRGLGFTRAAPPHGIANAFAWRVQHGFETLIEPLATVLGGAVGATRAVVDAAEIDASRLIGQSGLRVAPRLYIAVGVSGQPQHLQAITRARHVVAINPDPTAPIFEVADIAIIAEAERVIPDLITLIDAHRAKS